MPYNIKEVIQCWLLLSFFAAPEKHVGLGYEDSNQEKPLGQLLRICVKVTSFLTWIFNDWIHVMLISVFPLPRRVPEL